MIMGLMSGGKVRKIYYFCLVALVLDDLLISLY